MILIAILLGGISVNLRERANVRGAEIELGDIAEISGGDAAVLERVRETSLGWAPAVGFSRWLEAERIAAELQSRWPELTFEVRGATGCRASPSIEHVSGAAIEAVARVEIGRWLQGRDADLALAAHVADIDVPRGNRGSELRAVTNALDLRTTTLDVPVRVMVDGAVHRTVWTSWNVDLWESCSVPTRAVRAGEKLTQELFETRRVRANGARPIDASLLLGSVAASDLPAGAPISEQQVVRPNIVARGDTLALEIRRGLVCARISVVSDQAGKRGERIRVVQPGTERSWLATVVARDLVVIEKESK